MGAKLAVMLLIVPCVLIFLALGDVIFNAIYTHSEAVRHLIGYPEYDDENEDF